MHRHRRMVSALLALGLVLGSGVVDAAVVAVVAAGSPVTILSKNQLTDIFLGKTNRFPDGTLATPIDQPETSRLREEFYGSVAGKSLAQLKAYWSKIIFTGRGHPPATAANSVEVKRLLAANPAAIGYIDEAQVDASVRVVSEP